MGKRVTSKNAFAEFNFAEECGRERLCQWLFDVVNGKKPKPLIIVGPVASGKTELLRLIDGILGGTWLYDICRKNQTLEIIEHLHLDRCVVIDDVTYPRYRDGSIHDILLRVAEDGEIPCRKKFSTTEAVVMMANAAFAVVFRYNDEKRVLADTYLLHNCKIIQLAPLRPRSKLNGVDEYRTWLAYETADPYRSDDER